ncbi:hypothetical protein C4J81_09515 [Deltaproteobacteria bacterium Smac51]|nr:hypothetical protein C4J81_09515 [Deltaproteobacteria bacterium Smac51]
MIRSYPYHTIIKRAGSGPSVLRVGAWLGGRVIIAYKHIQDLLSFVSGKRQLAAALGKCFCEGSVPEVLVTEPSQKHFPRAATWSASPQPGKCAQSRWEPGAGDGFGPGSVTKDFRNGAGTKTIPGFRRVNESSKN